VVFSYRVGGDLLLEKVRIPVEEGGFILLTGKENTAFGFLGGVVAGVFPVERESVPRLDELVKYFMGTLDLHEGKIPDSAVYLGPDPEKHLLFSRVDEEIGAQLGRDEEPVSVLERFGLSPAFRERRIATLSGGEKMKLALSLAFAKSARCTVLHGIVPWLDGTGRELLLREIKKARERGGCVVVLEQETGQLDPLSDARFFFDGKTLSPRGPDGAKNSALENPSSFSMKEKFKGNGNSGGGSIVSFSNVDFGYPGEEGEFRLNGISLELLPSRIYGLTGDNGTGKSTIARLMLRLETPESGSVRLLGDDLARLGRERIMDGISYVSQFPEQQITLSTALQYIERASKKGNTLSHETLSRYFKEGEYPVSQLTPLDLKILTLGSSVNPRTKLIILDEPTWGMDGEGLSVLLHTITYIADRLEGASLFVISHDEVFMRNLGADLMRLQSGKIMRVSVNGDVSDRSRLRNVLAEGEHPEGEHPEGEHPGGDG